jgi:DNA-binding XRE family transcriptional regulator
MRDRPLSPLARARIRKGLTQVQLAALVHVHPMTIGTAERGAPASQLAARLAAALGVPVEELRR